MRPLVVGIDGSESGLHAVDWAVDEAARHGVSLRLVHASLWERYESVRSFDTDRPAEQVLAEHILASSTERARLRNPDVEVSAVLHPEDAPAALLQESAGAFAVVTGSRGRGGIAGRLLGSVSLEVAARAACPVIVVRGEERNRRGEFHRLVLGVGDAAEGSAAVRFALAEAAARRCPLDAVRAWHRPAHEALDHPLIAPDATARVHEEEASFLLTEALQAAAGAETGGLAETDRADAEADRPETGIHRRVTEGRPHSVLLDASAEADLVVVGAQRHHGHLGLQLGHVNHTLLHHALCPVAVVPEQARV
jgi:nucleotide-binding universal stress UspA family protein